MWCHECLVQTMNIGFKFYFFQQLQVSHYYSLNKNYHNIFVDQEFIYEDCYTSVTLFVQLNRDEIIVLAIHETSSEVSKIIMYLSSCGEHWGGESNMPSHCSFCRICSNLSCINTKSLIYISVCWCISKVPLLYLCVNEMVPIIGPSVVTSVL